MHRQIRYSLSKASDCKDHDGLRILAFTIRTTDGEDENYSSKRAEAKGTSLTEELISFSLVSYERETGEEVTDGTTGKTEPGTETVTIKHPFDSFTKWSTKARNFVVAAWKRLSTPNEDEIADFFKSATESA
jgi:hypothetical protein